MPDGGRIAVPAAIGLSPTAAGTGSPNKAKLKLDVVADAAWCRIAMGTKSHLRINPPPVRGGRRVFVHTVIRHTGRAALQFSRSRHQMRTDAQVNGPPLRNFPLQSQHERGTPGAVGLALALHAALAFLLFSGLHWTGSPPASMRVAVTDRSAPSPLASPAPRNADRPVAPVTGPVTPLTVAHDHSQVAPHHSTIPHTLHAPRDAHPAAHVLVARRPHTADARQSEQQANETADREREARVGALQAMAGVTPPEIDRQQQDRNITASPDYVGKVARRVRRNLVVPFAVAGNPSAVIAVTCAPNGALLSATLQRSSGNSQWDQAVLSAVERSDPMPRDVNGTTPGSFLITFQPRG